MSVSRFTANGSFGGVTCGVRVVAVAYVTKSDANSTLNVGSGTLALAGARIIYNNIGTAAKRETQHAYFGEEGVPITGRGYVKVSGASAAVSVVWRNL